MRKKESYVVSAAIVLATVVMLFSPMIGIAGSLEPSAAPAPTMKTLDQIPPTWSQKITGAARFELVLDDAAVLDKETGLVWEKSPSIATTTWVDAMHTCQNKSVGNRNGWHLPTVEQLASLVDHTVAYPGPTLPSGHPFTDVQSTYWSATTGAITAATAWGVFFSKGAVDDTNKTFSNYVWCVRGGQALDAY